MSYSSDLTVEGTGWGGHARAGWGVFWPTGSPQAPKLFIRNNYY